MLTNKAHYTTRERILESALKAFSAHGYIGATTREIAKQAGVAELTLFRQFSSKGRLFEEVINTYSFLPALKGMLSEINGLEHTEALALIARKFLERLVERKALIRIMHAEIHLYPLKVKKMYHQFIDEVMKTLASYFREMQRRGVLGEFDPELAARAFLGMFFSYFNAQEFMMRKDFSPADTEKIIREFVRLFAYGTLRGYPPANVKRRTAKGGTA